MFSFLTYAEETQIDLITQDQFFSQILDAVKTLGGIPWTMKIATIILILISSMKVSFIRPLWDKLGWAKGILAPVLGIVAGVLTLSQSGSLSLPGVMAYMFAGAGAVVLHELFEAMKLIPGITPTVLSVVQFFESALASPNKKESK